MRYTRCFTIAAVLLVPVTGVAVAAPPSMTDVLKASYALHDLEAVDLRPDGAAVAWEETFHAGLRDELPFHAVYVKRIATGAAAIRITAGTPSSFYDEEHPVWSPDGSRVAFFSDARSKGRFQIFVADRDGTHVRQAGTLHGEAQNLQWSPSGKSLSLLYIAEAHRKAGASLRARATSALSARRSTNSA